MGALLSILLITPVAAAQAQTNIQKQNQSEAAIEAYQFQRDPYLVEWTFRDTEETKVVSEDQEKENRILGQWKDKQAHKWAALPQEKFVVNASAYTAAADECGKNDGITSSGLVVQESRTLACPPNFPFGTKIYIEGVGERRCEDRGGAIKGNHIDIYMATKDEAFAFGRQQLEAYVVD